MTKNTHSSGGFLFALITLNIFISCYINGYEILYQILLIALFFHFANLGSVFPDIDMKGSYISKRYPLLSKAFKKCKHRGLTHSFIFLSILYVIALALSFISHENIVVISICGGFLIGYISHLVLDLLTKEGIELFFPFRANIRLFNIKTGSKGEKTFHKFLKLIIAIFLIYNVYLISIRYFHIDLFKLVMDKIKH
ncbi:metal-dependent hydrolase [Clostridium thermobutyricum]|uniref:Inner membrane protein YdjM n=1 Tax=Clostridium thermobutyricum DSM 4928 TaxID=1121339 RepID=A0A1V4STL9_9CLOT|nr:metal-dependent hydrolase [Clostridium thermobutyricum]OPX47194.1 inner membrane protein YdjM [Clostridium thermobutyricum DSM 4928]